MRSIFAREESNAEGHRIAVNPYEFKLPPALSPEQMQAFKGNHHGPGSPLNRLITWPIC